MRHTRHWQDLACWKPRRSCIQDYTGGCLSHLLRNHPVEGFFQARMLESGVPQQPLHASSMTVCLDLWVLMITSVYSKSIEELGCII